MSKLIATRMFHLLVASVIALPVTAQATNPPSATIAPPSAKPAPAPAAAGPKPVNRVEVAKKLDQEFVAIDSNKDAAITESEIKEFQAASRRQVESALRQRQEEQFARLDANKDGQISKAEFMAVTPVANIQTPESSKVIARFDANKDGKVNKAEFLAPALADFDRRDSNHDGVLSLDEQKANTQQR